MWSDLASPIPTNRQVRQGKNSQLEHVATHRIQCLKQQSVKDVTQLHQVPSDDGPAIEGTWAPFPTVTTITTERCHPPLIMMLVPPISLSFPAVALSLAFLSTFLLVFLSLAFSFSFPLSFLSALSPAIGFAIVVGFALVCLLLVMLFGFF